VIRNGGRSGRQQRSRRENGPLGRRGPISESDLNDDGQILPMVIAYALIAFTLVIVIIDITAVHLQRQRLFSLTDAAALDAADALDRARFYREGAAESGDAGVAVLLTDLTVRASVERYLLTAAPLARVSNAAIDDPTGSPDGVTAEVTLSGRATLPLFSFAAARWSDGVPIRATARARARASP
jgi:uncharacterized membrane protein